MAAGLGFKNFASGEVLTAADVNGYLNSQTVMVFADAAARTAAITSPQEGMISYLKDTNATQYYSGSAWVGVGAASPLTTKGDVYTYSTTDARIGVGANDTVLTADSSTATGLKWAAPASGGGMTLLSTTTLSGSSVSVTGISQDYKNLLIITYLLTSGSTRRTRISPNGLSQVRGTYTATRTTIDGTTSNDDIFVQGWDLYSTGGDANCSQTTIYNYSSTAGFKPFTTSGTLSWASNGEIGVFGGGGIATESAITSITISGGGVSFTGGTMLIYGVK